jgi:hypothetical protein
MRWFFEEHKSMNPRILVIALAVAAGLAAPRARANPDDATCCLQTTSKLDAAINPVKNGDERFFTISASIPNVIFAIDSSGSMAAYPSGICQSNTNCSDCSGTGCSCFGDTGYDPTKVYPPEIGTFNTAGGNVRLDGQGGRTGWFAVDTVYELRNGQPGGYGSSTTVNPAGLNWTGVDRNSAITAACTAPATIQWVDYGAHCGSCPASGSGTGSWQSISCTGAVDAQVCNGKIGRAHV